ncbi:hypothetical protein GALMADRAFT_1082929 [Galerina marginata CBS 339.88]|uniref:Transmembrane protein n=1 Tax=Galerina marginata (strain CBS 339.88) TaxID=685588 RepID=A0A067SLF0_GALM3|nr:hypothetical protein GALMADRAFT_1082929 [Galerina marginata CBS 339.88]
MRAEEPRDSFVEAEIPGCCCCYYWHVICWRGRRRWRRLRLSPPPTHHHQKSNWRLLSPSVLLLDCRFPVPPCLFPLSKGLHIIKSSHHRSLMSLYHTSQSILPWSLFSSISTLLLRRTLIRLVSLSIIFLALISLSLSSLRFFYTLVYGTFVLPFRFFCVLPTLHPFFPSFCRVVSPSAPNEPLGFDYRTSRRFIASCGAD